jgi:ribosomal protein S18 acetylase RimI-like enzyme
MLTPPLPLYRIRYATDADYDALINLRIHAETWLRAAGIEQWTVRAAGENAIRRRISTGNAFAVTTGAGDIIATLSLDKADPAFWTPDEAVEPALYLYSFIISSERRGRGLGDALLDWASERAADGGARWLRLDCWKTNDRLHRFYERRGFVHLDTRDAPGRKSGALFQRDAGTTLVGEQRVRLIDETQPTLLPSGLPTLPSEDRYDPTGEAHVWYRAAEEIAAMMREPHPGEGAEVDHWRAALDAASKRLDTHAREIRQAHGMYYRPLDGTR